MILCKQMFVDFKIWFLFSMIICNQIYNQFWMFFDSEFKQNFCVLLFEQKFNELAIYWGHYVLGFK